MVKANDIATPARGRAAKKTLVDVLGSANYLKLMGTAKTDLDIEVGDVLFWNDKYLQGQADGSTLNADGSPKSKVVGADFVEIQSMNLEGGKVVSFTYKVWRLDPETQIISDPNKVETRNADLLFRRCVDALVVLEGIAKITKKPVTSAVFEYMGVSKLFETALEGAEQVVDQPADIKK